MGESQVKHDKYGMKFKFALITDFVTADHKDDVHEKTDLNVLPLDVYIPRCPSCGSTSAIKKGYRTRVRKGDSIQRWGCKECGYRFIDDPTAGSHFPIWAVDRVLDLAARGRKSKEIVEEVKRESSLLGQRVTMSVQSIPNLIKRYVEMLLLFEQFVPRKETPSEWQIDDSPQRFSEKKSLIEQMPKVDPQVCQTAAGEFEKRRRFFWITNVFQVENRYWLSALASINRGQRESENALKLALKRAKCAPGSIRCDGSKSHIRGIKKCLQHVPILSKTKKQDYAWINMIERLHRTMRGLAIKKRRPFRSLETLQYLVELVRVYYNFLRPHEALSGDTPAKRAGIAYPHGGWSDLIRYAQKIIRKYEGHFH